MADDPDQSGKTTFNEQAKLTATYINGLAVAVMTVGGFSPLVGMLQGRGVDSSLGYFALGCVVLSLVLHLVARSVLEGMRD